MTVLHTSTSYSSVLELVLTAAPEVLVVEQDGVTALELLVPGMAAPELLVITEEEVTFLELVEQGPAGIAGVDGADGLGAAAVEVIAQAEAEELRLDMDALVAATAADRIRTVLHDASLTLTGGWTLWSAGGCSHRNAILYTENVDRRTFSYAGGQYRVRGHASS